MKSMTRSVILLMIIFIILLAGCQAGTQTPSVGDHPFSISVSILPEAYFVERIAGDLAEVNVMVGPGDDPHSYEPTPDQMRMLDDADIYFSIGVEFEAAWLPRFQSANQDLVIVDASTGVERIPMAAAHEGEDAGEPDPHIWLSPSRVHIIAENMAGALIEIDPGNSSKYQANLAEFIDDIDTLDADIRLKLEDITKRQFLTFHPAWGYFADDYDLEMVAIEVGGQEPGAESLAGTISLMDQYQLDVIFMQKEFSSKSAQAIADETGARVVIVDPLARDWLSNMQTMTDAFVDALQ
jgi:zinc transport system substrate-binding protein